VILLSFIPVLFNWLGTSYLVMIFIMDGIILWFTIKMLRSRTSDEGRRCMRQIYMGSLFGMLAFILGNVLE
jgi:geranylgeranylglycerol-phosphate geranylgeranyltransferase